MVRGDLQKIIQSYQAKGYSFSQIRQGLIDAGWSVSEIDEAFISFQPPSGRNRSWVIIAVVALVFLIILVGTVLFFVPGAPSQLLDVSVEPVKTEVAQSSPVDFIIQLVNLGKSRRFDVGIRSELVSIASNDILASKTETVAIETRNAVKSQLIVPADARPGRYVVRILVEYDKQSARSSFSLVVVSSEKQRTSGAPAAVIGQEPAVGCPGGCNDYDSCTIDRCVKGICVFDKIVPCCGNGVCERGESETFCPEDCAKLRPTVAESVQAIIDRAFTASGADPDSGVRLCRTLSQLSDQDLCLSGVAKRSGQPDICGLIVQDKDKDGCFLDFALGRDRFDLCDKVQDRWLKSSCFSYANLKKTGQ